MSDTSFKDFINREKRDIESFEFTPDSFRIAGDWPVTIKTTLTVVLLTLVIALSLQFHFKTKYAYHNKLKKEEIELTNNVMAKITQSAGIEEYNAKIKDMNKSFEALLSKLPTDIEMDGLLSDITKNGINNGIEFKNFQMLKEVKTEFYVDHPIEITIAGTYHSLGKFISDISNLSRIVTFHDFEMTDKTTDNQKLLEIKMVAKTYKYEENKESSNE